MRQFRAWCLGNTVRYFIIITYVIIIITTTTISLLPFHYQDHHFPTSCSAGIKCDSQDMAFLVNFLEVVVFFFFFPSIQHLFQKTEFQHSPSLPFPLSNFLQFITQPIYLRAHRILLYHSVSIICSLPSHFPVSIRAASSASRFVAATQQGFSKYC